MALYGMSSLLSCLHTERFLFGTAAWAVSCCPCTAVQCIQSRSKPSSLPSCCRHG